MTTSLPETVQYGRVYGQVTFAEADGPDEDNLPDAVPATGGTITFAPPTSLTHITAGGRVILLKPITVTLNSEGRFDVRLVATDTPGSNVDWTYRVTLKANGAPDVTWNMHVPSGSETDLVDIVPVTNPSGGTAIARGRSAYELWVEEGNSGTLGDFFESLRGPKGDKGDPPANPELSATVTTLEPDDEPEVTVSGEYPQVQLAFALPRGEKGEKGDEGGTPVIVSSTMPTERGVLWIDPSDHEVASRRIFGTGSPNGVVAAPPGYEYVDEAGTCGAWLWRKRSGTGNTGWVCVEGDTGWRKVPVTVPGHPGLTEVWLRRVNDTVTVSFTETGTDSDAGTANTEVCELPAGFRKRQGEVYAQPVFNASSGYLFTNNTVLYMATNDTRVLRLRRAGSARHMARGLHFTTDPWPTELPGEPV